MARRVEIAGGALVLRFSPVLPEKVLERARLENVRDGHYGLSVFADEARLSETDSDVLDRLHEASGLAGIAPQSRYWICSRASSLLERGFEFLKDEEAAEVAEHYCVNLGPSPDIPRVVEFLDRFERRRR